VQGQALRSVPVFCALADCSKDVTELAWRGLWGGAMATKQQRHGQYLRTRTYAVDDDLIFRKQLKAVVSPNGSYRGC